MRNNPNSIRANHSNPYLHCDCQYRHWDKEHE